MLRFGGTERARRKSGPTSIQASTAFSCALGINANSGVETRPAVDKMRSDRRARLMRRKFEPCHVVNRLLDGRSRRIHGSAVSWSPGSSTRSWSAARKGLAERILYGSFEIIQQRSGRNPLEVFEQALHNSTPVIEVKPRRVGGATYQVPVQIEGAAASVAGDSLAAERCADRAGKSMQEKLANELLDAANGWARRSSGAKTPTAWPRRTAPSPTIGTSTLQRRTPACAVRTGHARFNA